MATITTSCRTEEIAQVLEVTVFNFIRLIYPDNYLAPNVCVDKALIAEVTKCIADKRGITASTVHAQFCVQLDVSYDVFLQELNDFLNEDSKNSYPCNTDLWKRLMTHAPTQKCERVDINRLTTLLENIFYR